MSSQPRVQSRPLYSSGCKLDNPLYFNALVNSKSNSCSLLKHWQGLEYQHYWLLILYIPSALNKAWLIFMSTRVLIHSQIFIFIFLFLSQIQPFTSSHTYAKELFEILSIFYLMLIYFALEKMNYFQWFWILGFLKWEFQCFHKFNSERLS